MSSTDEPNAYEQLRLERIRRNELELDSVGIRRQVPPRLAAPAKASKKKTQVRLKYAVFRFD